MTLFRYSRPDESFVGATCAGAVDTDFNVQSLCNGSPGDPVKKTGGLSVSATALQAVSIGVVALCNHNLGSSGTAAIGGTVSGTITNPAVPANGIPLNPYILPTPASGASVTLTTTGEVVGELWVGVIRTLERGLRVDAQLKPPEPFEWEGQFGSIPPNDDGTEARTLTGEAVVTGTGLADIEEWYRSTRRGTLPTLIIPFDGVQDAWLATFSYDVRIGWRSPAGSANSIYTVSFTFKEFPRSRW